MGKQDHYGKQESMLVAKIIGEMKINFSRITFHVHCAHTHGLVLYNFFKGVSFGSAYCH